MTDSLEFLRVCRCLRGSVPPCRRGMRATGADGVFMVSHIPARRFEIRAADTATVRNIGRNDTPRCPRGSFNTVSGTPGRFTAADTHTIGPVRRRVSIAAPNEAARP